MGTAGYPNGKRIRLLRVERDIGAQDLAERIGISRRHLYNVERGRKATSIGVLLKISREFGVPLDDLILRDDSTGAAKAA
jgi:transcriptional regulator with XRE-family HTH domain